MSLCSQGKKPGEWGELLRPRVDACVGSIDSGGDSDSL